MNHDCGLMNLVSRFCNAKHFESETILYNRTAFILCCHKRKFSTTINKKLRFRHILTRFGCILDLESVMMLLMSAEL